MYYQAPAGSIIMASDGEKTMIGINGDGSNTNALLRLVPPSNDNCGQLFLGVEGDFPQSGVNDHGLMLGLLSTAAMELQYEPDKMDIEGNPLAYLLKRCSTVDEVLQLVDNHNIMALEVAQLIAIDQTGAAAVVSVGKDKHVVINNKARRHQVLTDLNLACVDEPDANCIRCQYANDMLSTNPQLSLANFRNVLSAIHCEGSTATIYSAIISLPAFHFYLYRYHDFGNGIQFDLKQAFDLESREVTYAIQELFPVKMAYVAEKQAQNLREEIEKLKKLDGSRKRAKKLIEIEGIGEVYAQKLGDIGILTVEELLEKGASPAGRTQIIKSAGISEKLILEWVNHADLFRINGVGEEYADLLEEAGVDTVPELAQRNPENLYELLVEVNQQKNLVRNLPGSSQVKDWIEQAKNLPRVINY